MARAGSFAAVAALCAGMLWVLARPRPPMQAGAGEAIVWVFFHPDSARSTAPPAVSEEAVRLRAERGVPTYENDRPLPADLIERVEAAGARLRHESRWLRAVSVAATPSSLERLSSLPAVIAIRPVGTLVPAGSRPGAALPSVRAAAAANRPSGAAAVQVSDSLFYGPNWPAVRDLGIAAAHGATFTGKGIRVAILDTGFEPRHESLEGRRVFAARDFINGDSVVYDEPADPPGVSQSRHGTQVWSILGGYLPGTIVGPAYDAQFILAKVKAEPGLSRADEDRWVAAVEWADSLGARLIASALYFRFGFSDRPDITYGELNGDSTLTTRIADEAARRGILVVNAVGDVGPLTGTLAAPADADSIVAVGAVDAAGQAATFPFGATSRGPTADGRIKPDVAARGTGLFAASSLSLGAYDISLAGTSYATALVAGGAAVFMEAWPNLSATAVGRALVLAGRQSGRPDNLIGAGVPDIASAILFPDGLEPTTITTVDLNGAVTTLAPTFNWRASLVQRSMGPVLYRLDLATDSLFAAIVYSDTVREAFALGVRRPIRPEPRLWWRVTARASLGVERTSPAAGPFAVPNWVRLVSPDPDQVTFVSSARPELAWAPLAAPAPIGPFVYDVEVLSNETGAPVQPAQRDLTTASVRVAQPLIPNTAYRWRVIARTQGGPADTVESTNPFVVTSETLPPSTLLHQNFPNPFPRRDLGRLETQVWFDLADTATVELTVLDLRGRLVQRLIPAEPACGPVTLVAGIYGRGGPLETPEPCVRTSWDGRNASGETVPRGVYILRLRANGRDFYRRMLFLPEG